ncbi:MAG TPA: methyltransferase domain-containing protein [Flavisolibacter sp.]|nr:methyltransferase domain-containing protein [Flavisolibacter sp.]
MFTSAKRSYQKELLDSSDIPFRDIMHNMQELEFINQYLGGHAITIDGVNKLINEYDERQPIKIVELGCGGGDNLRAIQKWASKRNIPVSLTGIDINQECIQYASSRPDSANIRFIHSDYRNVQFQEKHDILFSSLFCHHFTDTELVSMFKYMHHNSAFGFFINDLHRHPFAYYLIKWLTQLFSKSYLVKNDAPLSVSRGFTRKDWTHLLREANISTYTCEWKWAFRWLISVSTYGVK